MFFRLRSISFILLMIFVVGFVIAPEFEVGLAQSESHIEQLAINVTDNQIAFYEVSSDNQLTLLDMFTDFKITNLADQIPGQWEIRLLLDISPSPDKQHIAFTATNSRGETSLFLYTVGHSAVHEKSVQGIGSIIWSPDSESLLLIPPTVRTDFQLSVSDIYQYTLATDDILSLTNTPEVSEIQVMWMPTSEQIAFRVQHSIYSLDVSTQQESEIVDVEAEFPQDIGRFCYPSNIQWSDDERIYYAIGCNEHEYLYSMIFQQGNRLELDLPSLYPNARTTNINDIYRTMSGNILVITSGENWEDDGVFSFWHILDLTSPTQVTTFATDDTFTGSGSLYITTTAPSADEKNLAIAGYADNGGYLAIVNLSTGVPTTFEIALTVCELLWIDDNTLQFTSQDGTCNSGANAPRETWQLDLTTEQFIRIGSDLEGFTWILD